MRRALAGALAVALLFVAPTALAQDCSSAVFQYAPAAGAAPGDTVSVLGLNFTPDSEVLISVSPPGSGHIWVNSAPTNAAGAFTTNFILPDMSPGGGFIGVDDQIACSGTQPFAILAPPPPPTTAATTTSTAPPTTTTTLGAAQSSTTTTGPGATTASSSATTTLAVTTTEAPSEDSAVAAAASSTTLVAAEAPSSSSTPASLGLTFLFLAFFAFLAAGFAGGVWVERNILAKRSG